MNERGHGRSASGLVVPLAFLVVSLLAFAGLQAMMPPTFQSPPGVNPGGARWFVEAWIGRAPPALSAGVFAWSFRLLLSAAWAGYAFAVLAGLRGASLGTGRTAALVTALCAAYALFCPPSLSRDAYAYTAFARMTVMHGENPYLHTLASLAARGDDAAAYYPADTASTYGPVWTLVSVALLWCLKTGGLWAHVLGMKLMAAASTVVAAFAGREIARRHDPRHADLTLMAIGLNPLLLIEGAGNGHNDLLMMALLLVGIALQAKGRSVAGLFFAGLSMGVKFVTAAVIPWMVLTEVMARGGSVERGNEAGRAGPGSAPPSSRAGTRRFIPVTDRATELPPVAPGPVSVAKHPGGGEGPDRGGGADLEEQAFSGAAGDRTGTIGAARAARQNGPMGRCFALLAMGAAAFLPTAAAYLPFWAGRATFGGVTSVYAIQAGASFPVSGRLLAMLSAVVLYAGLTVWIGWKRRAEGLRAAWVIFAAALALLVMPVLFPWYLVWSCALSLTGWAPLERRLALACNALACALLVTYSLPMPS